jgi:prevent-host-death family protein
MKISAADAKNQFSNVLNRAAFGGERIILTRRGKPVAAVVPMEDLEKLERMEDQADLKEARKELRNYRKSGEKGVPLEEVARELGIKLPKRSS